MATTPGKAIVIRNQRRQRWENTHLNNVLCERNKEIAILQGAIRGYQGIVEKRNEECGRYINALQNVQDELAGCLERDAKAFMSMTMEQVEAWDIARHNQSHGYCLDQIRAALNA